MAKPLRVVSTLERELVDDVIAQHHDHKLCKIKALAELARDLIAAQDADAGESPLKPTLSLLRQASDLEDGSD